MLKLAAQPVLEARHSALRERVQEFVKRYRRQPLLTVVLVGEDPASVTYTRKKGETAIALGCNHHTLHFPSTTAPSEIKKTIEQLNRDPRVDGILIQRPLPKTFCEEEVLLWISPEKDVDAFHPVNAGRLFLGLPSFQPCTPAGILCLLKHYQISIAGKIACVVGRSSTVGRPMATLLLQADATLIHCHSKTLNLPSFTRQADLLIVAVGRPEFLDAAYIKPGAVIIDVGIHRKNTGQIVGDVQYNAASEVAAAITPVPGGVGPMTISVLMENTIWAAEQRERN